LSLLENPVTRKEVRQPTPGKERHANRLQNYRLYIIHLLPSLRFLDFQRIRDAERKQSADLFGTLESPTELAAKIRGVKSKAFDNAANVNGKTANKGMRTQLSATEKQRVQEMIKNARSIADITKIEKDLAEGRIPAGAADADRMVS
jgi:U2 small nuclear ribonucleoprotein A'